MIKSDKLIKIHEKDNVAVALEAIHQGESVVLGDFEITAKEDIDKGHKIAFKDIPEGDHVIKYGFPIGHATRTISAGEYIHTHNIKTNLKGVLEYSYLPELSKDSESFNNSFMGYVRENGEVGIRNEIWIVNTVGCVNKTAEIIAKEANKRFAGKTDGIFAFPHPFGCSQLGEDHLTTQKILADMVNHPNAAGVLVLGLGCENNNIPEFKKVLGEYNDKRVKFLITQEVEDEIEAGLDIIDELVEYAQTFEREECPASKLIVGLKCGGSDGFSGITGNPLVGALSDVLIQHGGTSILSEVPEMFGAETILMNRCINEEVFNKTVDLINNFKEYFIKHDQEIYENPSPGNKKGGISTLEEKSLGCTQKGGAGNVVDVLDYGERVSIPGLNLLKGPGNDIIACTALMAAGAHIILFTTGRGTPLGAPVPTVKVATNSDLFTRKSNWMDFNAGQLLEGKDINTVKKDFFEYVLKIASGEIKTKNEINGYREISIFKDGVIL
ncbi:altronate dehydratase family protein [Petroclostridium sp. X23]|uniref:UxaA family hydrolase n=1 Tax=Petroclostridium sp. X23 TaxID=3045146 RepID=UPI0024AD3532|nr:altronate dehydratase family protein [Petroclostridium sp. X23]WHH60291.1 altronate dehydratase family protein [Petroclostridium sp. X23]